MTTNFRAGPSRLTRTTNTPVLPIRTKRVYRDEDIIDLTTPSPSPPLRQRALPELPMIAMESEESSEENRAPSPVLNIAPVNTRRVAKPKPTTSNRTTKTKSSLQKTTTTTRPKPASNPDMGKMPFYKYSEYTPRPVVLYLRTEQEVDEALEGLDGTLGFDLEWKVSRGRERPAALVQLSDTSMILLIQVTAMPRFPPNLKALIENPAIPKLGVNIRNDGMKLYRDYGVLARNLVELGALACAADTRFAAAYNRPIVSLAKVTAWYMRRTLDKGPVRTSDWERPLSREQVQYAANDAHCAIMIYKRIMSIARAAKVSLDSSTYSSDLMKELEPPPAAPVPVSPFEAAAAGATAPSKPATRTRTSTSAKPQHLRAYNLWREGHGLLDICIKLRSRTNPLRESTVVTYVVSALEADVQLPFSMTGLQTLVKGEAGGWHRHRDTILAMGEAGRGQD
ncbi:ribonuclease H-like protein, partial [Peniophora sp. CONT]